MADPLSIIAGISGIAVASAQLANSLHTLCDRAMHAPSAIRDLSSNMSLLSGILDAVADVLDKGKGVCKPQVLSNTSSILKRMKRVQKEVRKIIKQNRGLRARISWALNFAKVAELLQRIEALKSALTLLLLTVQLAVSQKGTENAAKRDRLGNLVECAVRESREAIAMLKLGYPMGMHHPGYPPPGMELPSGMPPPPSSIPYGQPSPPSKLFDNTFAPYNPLQNPPKSPTGRAYRNNRSPPLNSLSHPSRPPPPTSATEVSFSSNKAEATSSVGSPLPYISLDNSPPPSPSSSSEASYSSNASKEPRYIDPYSALRSDMVPSLVPSSADSNKPGKSADNENKSPLRKDNAVDSPYHGGMAEYTDSMYPPSDNPFSLKPSYDGFLPRSPPSFTQEETASWLYQLVFLPTLDPQPNISDQSTQAGGDEKSAVEAGEVISSRGHSSRTVHDGQHATDAQIAVVPAPNDLYGLSVRSTVEDLLGAWTYVDPGELLLKRISTSKNKNKTKVVNDEILGDTYTSEGSAESGEYHMDDSSWEDIDEKNLAVISSPLDKQVKSNSPRPSKGKPPPQSLDETKDRTSVEVHRSPSPPPLLLQPSQAKELLERLEKLVVQFGDDMKKAEKQRTQTEQFRKKEQDGKFRRLEELLISQKEAWKAMERRDRKAVDEARARAVEMQNTMKAEDTFKEEKIPDQENAKEAEKASGENSRAVSASSETGDVETKIDTEAEVLKKQQRVPRGRRPDSARSARKQVQDGKGWRRLKPQEKKAGEERGLRSGKTSWSNF